MWIRVCLRRLDCRTRENCSNRPCSCRRMRSSMSASKSTNKEKLTSTLQQHSKTTITTLSRSIHISVIVTPFSLLFFFYSSYLLFSLSVHLFMSYTSPVVVHSIFSISLLLLLVLTDARVVSRSMRKGRKIEIEAFVQRKSREREREREATTHFTLTLITLADTHVRHHTRLNSTQLDTFHTHMIGVI